MKKLWVLLLAIALVACSKKIDGTDIKSFEESINNITREMSAEEAKAFRSDLYKAGKLISRSQNLDAGAAMLLALSPQSQIKLLADNLHGKTASDVRDMAQEWESYEQTEKTRKQNETARLDGAAGGSVMPHVAAPKPAASGPVQVIQVRSNQVTTVGGDLLAVTEDGSAVGPKVLVLKGMKLNGLTNDLVTLLTVYRYADRDVVLLTHGCGGSACSYTSIAVMDITAQGAPMLFQHDELTIAGDGQEPEVKVQPDGSLLVSFEGFKGRQTWRYAQRELVKL